MNQLSVPEVRRFVRKEMKLMEQPFRRFVFPRLSFQAELHQSGERPAAAGAVRRRRLLLVAAVATFGVTALLVTIFEHRQEARTPFVRVVLVNELSTDPVPWGMNWPNQFDAYRRTVDRVERGAPLRRALAAPGADRGRIIGACYR